ncbi:MAG: hypothetical protein UU41_C0041G0008 [Candidatus Roizmanbacteria bacterium GW2011_GWA1_41_13]|nr:MAG: hypothetical protein UU41_C0041G0008 [Candidatus Roizmanbacteria bacterium GW2011_GWA1_41_13]
MHTLADVNRGLNDLRNSLKNDVLPVLDKTAGVEEGGYFIVTREIFSYTGFLGLLYYGPENPPNPMFLSRTFMAERYITDVMGQVDNVYSEYGELIYSMYRHGTVHVYRPNMLESTVNHRKISFMCYKGPRKGILERKEVGEIAVTHCSPVQIKSDEDWLPLSINVLYDDLIKSIDIYEEMVKNHVLLENYSNAIDALSQPTPVGLSW